MKHRRFPTSHQPTPSETQHAINQIRDAGYRVMGWTKTRTDSRWAVVVHYADGTR